MIIGTMSRSECHLTEKLPEISYSYMHVSIIKKITMPNFSVHEYFIFNLDIWHLIVPYVLITGTYTLSNKNLLLINSLLL